MGFHQRKEEVERLARRLTERYDALITVMEGRASSRALPDGGKIDGIWVRGEDIRFAVDDVATALKEIKSRLGKD
ncbi:hypothetical protein EGT09_08600 [Pseudomonas putida]|uniref:hypothetical protein n=1 Tax=Pseudomonas putida TaxID=303 RepID=UPI000F78EA1E|nr:hypothetical protein [Pseudomonas putida]RSC26471.1 hypothetical protein EGT09_08600 [Pseudomonas putida]